MQLLQLGSFTCFLKLKEIDITQAEQGTQGNALWCCQVSIAYEIQIPRKNGQILSHCRYTSAKIFQAIIRKWSLSELDIVLNSEIIS